MQEKIKHYLKETIYLILFVTLFANAISLYKSTELNKNPLTLKSVTLLDNSSYTLEKNKPLLIHFWATWCPTCKLEAQNIQRISQDYNVLSIAVNSGTKKEIQNYMQEHDLSFKVVDDANSIYANEFHIAAYPTTFIYDKNKNLVFSEVGYTSSFGLWLRLLWAEYFPSS